MVKFTHEETGTLESTWRRAGVDGLADLPAPALPEPGRPLVVLSAHPDDETLGAAGLIHHALRAGCRVHVIVATAGEGSHPHSPTHAPLDLARLRTGELEDALNALRPDGSGAGLLSFELLSLPDGSVAGHLAEIESALRTVARAENTLVAAPYRHDGHIDHDALGTLAAHVCAELGLGLLEYPIWYWHWAAPGRDAEWTRWHTLALDPEAVRVKAEAMKMHHSQVAPLSAAPQDAALLQDSFLEHFRRTAETFRFTPAGLRDSATATATFDELHAGTADPWHFLGNSYEERKRALTIASLPRPRYSTAMELGCSIGVLSRELAKHVDSLLAVDASEVALRSAARRVAETGNVTLHRAVLPHQWPTIDPASLELVVVSEIGYFLAPDELDVLLGRCLEALAPGGHLLLCHWLHPIHGWPLDGEHVHAAANKLGLTSVVLHREKDFLLEILAKGGDGHG